MTTAEEISPGIGIMTPAVEATEVSSPVVNLLALVHLRNIYNSTGAGRVARLLIENLAERGDVRLRVLADAADHARIVPLVGAPWDRLDYRFFASETSRQQARWFLTSNPKAESYWPEAQVVFCTAEAYVPVKKARLAVTVHDAAYFEQDAHRHDAAFRKQRFKWQLLYRRLAAKADLFHAVSQFSAERLSHFFPAIASRIRVVHNGVTPFFFEPNDAEGREYLKKAGLNDRPYVLVPGGLHYRKNADLILEAWPALRGRFPDLSLAIVNHSNPEYAAKAQQLGTDIHLLGFVSDSALRALYSHARVVWFPSRYEGFGLPVVEAMACGGAPVLTSRASSLPEIAGDAALLVPPDSSHDHVDALHLLLTDNTLREDLIRRGRGRAAQFTWKASAAQLKAHFGALL